MAGVTSRLVGVLVYLHGRFVSHQPAQIDEVSWTDCRSRASARFHLLTNSCGVKAGMMPASIQEFPPVRKYSSIVRNGRGWSGPFL